MILIYMDNCCLNRILDDRRIISNYLEHNSVMIILGLIEKGLISLCGSEMLRKEIEDTPDLVKREKLRLMYSLCSTEIKITKAIAERAVNIRDLSNIRVKDSIHVACSETAQVDAFLTVDKKLMNNANRIPVKVNVMNPTQWLKEVYFYGDNDEKNGI